MFPSRRFRSGAGPLGPLSPQSGLTRVPAVIKSELSCVGATQRRPKNMDAQQCPVEKLRECCPEFEVMVKPCVSPWPVNNALPLPAVDPLTSRRCHRAHFRHRPKQHHLKQIRQRLSSGRSPLAGKLDIWHHSFLSISPCLEPPTSCIHLASDRIDFLSIYSRSFCLFILLKKSGKLSKLK